MKRYKESLSPMRVRMVWGNQQEATALLTALNYFCGKDNRTMIHEVGMCGTKFDDEDEEEKDLLLRIGASPDALICHGDGTVEVLEVKNHCPFVNRKTQFDHRQKGKKKRRGGAESSLIIRDFDRE